MAKNRDSIFKFLMKIDSDFKEKIKETETEFLKDLIETRQLLVEKLQEILRLGKNLKVKDLVVAIQVINDEIRKSEKMISKFEDTTTSTEDTQENAEILELEKRLALLEDQLEESAN